MTTGIQNVPEPVLQAVSATSEATDTTASLSISQAAATAGDSVGVTATTANTVTKPANPNKGIESKVREYFSDLPIMAEVSKCESRYRQYEPDGSIFRGIVNHADVGVMQINEYYHAKRAKKLGIDLRTVEGNLKYARLLYDEEGTRPWVSSSPCWMKSEVAKAMYGNSKVATNSSTADTDNGGWRTANKTVINYTE